MKLRRVPKIALSSTSWENSCPRGRQWASAAESLCGDTVCRRESSPGHHSLELVVSLPNRLPLSRALLKIYSFFLLQNKPHSVLISHFSFMPKFIFWVSPHFRYSLQEHVIHFFNMYLLSKCSISDIVLDSANILVNGTEDPLPLKNLYFRGTGRQENKQSNKWSNSR